MVRTNSYHPSLTLIASIGYEPPGHGARVAGHAYQYDGLMRPIQRQDSWDAATPRTTRSFTYNSRSELIEDWISQGGSFSYQYDNISNRKTSRELEKEVSYDATDRPVAFISLDGRTIVTCGYDYRGRHFEKKVTVHGIVSVHSWFLYRDYLQVAQLDLMQPEPGLLKSYLWDPTEPSATRVLMMTWWKGNAPQQKEHLYFMHDALKNVSSIVDGQQIQQARYEYAPFGSLLTAEGDRARENKFRFSCEFSDDELGLVCYNYRHLNPANGRWISRDSIAEQGGQYLYGFLGNNPFVHNDILGLWSWSQQQPQPPAPTKEIKKCPDKNLISVIVRRSNEITVDADGSPHAYHPKNTGLDDNRNGGIGKDNYGIVSPDVIQGKNDPAPGYYVSVTALFDPRKKKTDPRRYVNSEVIPYLVFNKEDRKKGAKAGDYATITKKMPNGDLLIIHAILADYNPHSKGEGSIKLVKELKGNPDPRKRE